MKLHSQSRAVLTGEVTLQFRKDSRRAGKLKRARKKALPDNIDPDLFEALRARRTSLAKQQGVPPYVVFHDKTLAEIAAFMPQDLQQFSQISGVGESKLEKYGEEFLEVVRDKMTL